MKDENSGSLESGTKNQNGSSILLCRKVDMRSVFKSLHRVKCLEASVLTISPMKPCALLLRVLTHLK